MVNSPFTIIHRELGAIICCITIKVWQAWNLSSVKTQSIYYIYFTIFTKYIHGYTIIKTR